MLTELRRDSSFFGGTFGAKHGFDRTLAKTEAPTELAQLVIVSRRTLTKLKKVYKLADTAEERYGKYYISHPRVRTQLDLLKGECEKTDEIFSKYSKASKYGKDVDGKPITSAYLGALLGEMEAQFQSMCGDVKSVKNYCPAPTKGDK